MTTNEIIVEIINTMRNEMNILLSEKTNWGRNDLKFRLEQLYTTLALKAMSNIEKK